MQLEYSDFNPIIVLFLTISIAQGSFQIDVFQSYYSLISNLELELKLILPDTDFNPIIVLFLTILVDRNWDTSKFQSYYSLISNYKSIRLQCFCI